MSQMTTHEDTTTQPVLYIAMELSHTSWRLGFGNGRKRRHIRIPARNLDRLEQAVLEAKSKLEMPEECAVVSCYEAGRDGFWIHHCLTAQGVHNHVVDASSIQVKRRARQAKTDRIDTDKLLNLLIRYWLGEQDVWSVVRVPTPRMEDARRVHREVQRLKKERAAHSVRIRSLLILHGIEVVVNKTFPAQLKAVRTWDGRPVPKNLAAEVGREYERWKIADEQVRDQQTHQRRDLRTKSTDVLLKRTRLLMQLRGVGQPGAWVLVHELLWRDFRNRREVGAAAGLTSVPYSSGDSDPDQGISKAGNKRIRSLMVQLAWLWLHHQPDSDLSEWYQRRFGSGGSRTRRIGIVALARKLLIAFWKFVHHGIVPEGALLKA